MTDLIRDSVIARGYEMMDKAKDVQAKRNDDNSIYPLSLDELMQMEFPKNNWLVEDLIPMAGITVLSAAPASYKTWLLLEIALRVAEGDELLDRFKTEQTGVLMIDEENSLALVKQRFGLLHAKSGLPICIVSGLGFTLSDNMVRNVIKVCKSEGFGLVTFDSLVRVHSADENDASKMSNVFRYFKKIADAGISVLITHHNRKPGAVKSNAAGEMRGSSDILAAVDCHLALKRADDHHLILSQNKSRFAEEISPLELKVQADDESFTFEYIGALKLGDRRNDSVRRSIIELLANSSPLNQKQLLDGLEMDQIHINPRTLRNVIEGMVTNSVIEKSAGIGNTHLYILNPEAHPKSENVKS